MLSSGEYLAARSMSAFPLSIGTSLALESVFQGSQAPYDPERPIPQRVEIQHYDELWVNALTLFRNLLGACKAEAVTVLLKDDIAQALAQEMEVITTVVREGSNGRTRAVFYASEYQGLDQRFPHANVRVDNTFKQKYRTLLAQDSIHAYLTQKTPHPPLKIFSCDVVPEQRTNALMLTHYALDLCEWARFARLDLLESHTGVLKSRALWYTKYQEGKELMRIPFMRGFLAVFGDSQSFAPMERKLRQAVLEVAERYEWTAMTTRERVLFSLQAIPVPFWRDVLRSML